MNHVFRQHVLRIIFWWKVDGFLDERHVVLSRNVLTHGNVVRLYLWVRQALPRARPRPR